MPGSVQLHALSTPVLLVFLLLVGTTYTARLRKYYLAAEEVTWDYANGDNRNLLDINDQASANKFFTKSPYRIGSKYEKAVYVQYTDEYFTTKVDTPAYFGLLGPIISGEVGDTLEIHFLNSARYMYSIHPHGLFYLKEHESALYMDGTSGRLKHDDVVFPGERIKLIWNITESDAPTASDPNCIPWVYHSHVNSVRDASSGMIGVLVTCKPGILNDNSKRTDVATEFPLLVKVFDENLSWYINKNAQIMCSAPNYCQQLTDNEDADFISSNHMASINGRMFGHLEGLMACLGDRIAFYIIGMGNEMDIHSLYFHGQEMEYQHTRGDTVSVYSATFVAAESTITFPGEWLITDMVDQMEKNGIGAYLFATNCTNHPFRSGVDLGGVTRHYYLAAEEVTWDYGPKGVDDRTGEPLTKAGSQSSIFFDTGPSRIGGQYQKAVFKQYNDSCFDTKVSRTREDDHMGLLGPVLRAEVGDILMITLKNSVRFPISLLPHGLRYSNVEEIIVGSVSSGGRVKPGDTYTYTFHAPADLLDGSSEPCRNYLYTSAHDPIRDHNTGLVGPILICEKSYLESSHAVKEKFLLLTTFDENKSLLFDATLENRTVDKNDEGFQVSNTMYSINGFSFGNLPGLQFCNGGNITWYMMALGSEMDVNTVSFDGNTFTERDKHRDAESLVAGSTAVLQMTLDNPGKWIIESHSNLAKTNGMYSFYNVDTFCAKTDTKFIMTGTVRQYYIAAEEVQWDYAPFERNLFTGADLNDPRREGNIFIKDDEDFIGDVYKKAVYREYTDASFSTRKTRSREEMHLDLLGPTIRAEVGDIIKVYFKNMASRRYSIHAHGILYDSPNSGVDYVRMQSVAPGRKRNYTWSVPKRSGPGEKDPNCLPWLYFSNVDAMKDTNAGLVGTLLICNPGILDESGTRRKDVDREFSIMMSVSDENNSWYLRNNVVERASNRIGTSYSSDADFEESNKMHAINGRIYGNTPGLVMLFNESIAWYFLSIGTEIDLHSFHIHGHTLIHTSEQHRDDVIQMFPGMAESLEMLADNPGTWLLHCHVLDHIAAGMVTTYTVLKPGEPLPTDGDSSNIHVGRESLTSNKIMR